MLLQCSHIRSPPHSHTVTQVLSRSNPKPTDFSEWPPECAASFKQNAGSGCLGHILESLIQTSHTCASSLQIEHQQKTLQACSYSAALSKLLAKLRVYFEHHNLTHKINIYPSTACRQGVFFFSMTMVHKNSLQHLRGSKIR